MAKTGAAGVFASFRLAEHSTRPVYQQLYQELRQSILSGRLKAGSRLPATRVLADELGVSRNTILSAFDRLIEEGYLQSRVGSGTFVASEAPEDRMLPADARGAGRAVASTSGGVADANVSAPTLSARGDLLAHLSMLAGPATPAAFTPDIPAYDAFPIDTWARIIADSWRRITIDLLGYADAAGHPPLRAAIAAHLQAARRVVCQPEQVIVTSGSQQSFDLVARLLLDPGDAVWIEEPGYIGSRAAFSAAGARLVPVPVDAEGLDVDAGLALEPRPRAILVSPSRQYPLGMTLSEARRDALMAVSERTGAWIVEDDYDSEYRYRGRPLPALQSLDRGHRVVYLGTFSKSLLPAFRLGYLVVPTALATPFRTAKTIVDRHPPLLEQVALHEFMERGHFAGHIRKMRNLYEQRQAALLGELRTRLAGFLDVAEADTGMHLVGFLPDGVEDVAFAQALAEVGVIARPLAPYYTTAARRHGLILGFAATPAGQLHVGVERMVAVARRFGFVPR